MAHRLKQEGKWGTHTGFFPVKRRFHISITTIPWHFRVSPRPAPPHRNPIPIFEPLTRIGWPYALVDPAKVIGIVEGDEPDRVTGITPPYGIDGQIAGHVVKFLLDEMHSNRIPLEFLPLQAGVGGSGEFTRNSYLSILMTP